MRCDLVVFSGFQQPGKLSPQRDNTPIGVTFPLGAVTLTLPSPSRNMTVGPEHRLQARRVTFKATQGYRLKKVVSEHQGVLGNGVTAAFEGKAGRGLSSGLLRCCSSAVPLVHLEDLVSGH